MKEHNDEIKRKAKELHKRIRASEKELKDLRKTCKHSEFCVKDINFGKDSFKLRKVCKFCEEVIGFPSQQDLEDNGYT